MFAIDDDDEEVGEENEAGNDATIPTTNSTPTNTQEAPMMPEPNNSQSEKNEGLESTNSQFATWIPTPLSSWIDANIPIFQCYSVHTSGEEKRYEVLKRCPPMLTPLHTGSLRSFPPSSFACASTARTQSFAFPHAAIRTKGLQHSRLTNALRKTSSLRSKTATELKPQNSSMQKETKNS